MTREEALEYCANKDNGLYYYPEMSMVFAWLALMRRDEEVARALGASLCVVPNHLWEKYEEIDTNIVVAALIRGDIHAKPN